MAADRFILAHVRRLPLAARLTPEQVEWVAQATQVLRYEPGEIVYRQGDIPPGLLMFISGGASLTQRGADGIDRPFGQVSENEFINEASLASEIPSPVTLQISHESIVLFISRQRMRSVLAYHPDVRPNLNPGPVAVPQAPPPKTAQNLRANENVILQVRRHWWAVAGRFAWIILFIVLTWGGYFLARQAVPQFPWLFIAVPATIALLLSFFYVYAEWQNDLFVLTDRRVINVNETIFAFRKQVNEIPLDAVREILVAQPPFLDFPGHILGYGTLIIKTSGDSNNLALNQIPNPQNVQQLIFNRRKIYQEGLTEDQQNVNRNAIKADLNQLLGGADSTTGAALPSTSTTSHPGLLSIKYTNAKGETVYRKHRVVWTQHVFLPAVIILGGFITLLLGVIGFFLPFIIILLGAVLFYLADWDWRNDMYIIGDQTITIIHKRPLFLQDQKDQILLSQVENVVAEVNGFLNTLLQIGEVKLLLTGSGNQNAKRFTQVYQPQQIQQEISRRQDHAEQLKRQADAQRQRQSIGEYLSVYHESVNPSNPPNTNVPTYNAPPISSVRDNPPPAQESNLPPRVRDGSRPPGIPRIRRDNPPGG